MIIFWLGFRWIASGKNSCRWWNTRKIENGAENGIPSREIRAADELKDLLRSPALSTIREEEIIVDGNLF